MFLRASSEERPEEDAIRQRRVEVARNNPRWTEIPEPVRRGRFLIDAETDAVLVPYRGVIFGSGAAIEFGDQAPLFFYVDRAGDVIVLERKPATWSEVVAKRARRGAA